MDRFLGDLDQLWTLQNRPPLHHLTWDWWWWLVMLEGDEQTPHGKQLMVLWSTKDNPLVEVNGIEWKPSGRPGFDEEAELQWKAWSQHGGLTEKNARALGININKNHRSWRESLSLAPQEGGAVVPLLKMSYQWV